jgi:hypothetical protein
MRTLANDLEPQMFIHRLSSESQCSTDSVLSRGNVASRWPISTHSFDQQLTKETSVTIGEMVAKSETVTVWSLNSTIGDGWFTPSTDGVIYTVDWLSAIIKYYQILYRQLKTHHLKLYTCIWTFAAVFRLVSIQLLYLTFLEAFYLLTFNNEKFIA